MVFREFEVDNGRHVGSLVGATDRRCRRLVLCYDSCEPRTVRRVHEVILCDQGGQWLRGIEGSMRLLQPSRGRRREGEVHKGDCDCCKIETNTSLENYYRF